MRDWSHGELRCLYGSDCIVPGSRQLSAARLLLHVGFEARLCEQAAAFFQTVTEWQPTHVAIDLSMPCLDGLQVLERLAAAGCRARVIISSGAGRAEIDAALVHARSVGLMTAGVLSKPFSLSSLRKLLLADVDGA
jgi:FixJ family two-component response regulator